MNLGLLFAIILGLLIGLYVPKLMETHKEWGRFFLLIIMVGLVLMNWKAGKVRDAYIYFEIIVWLLFGLIIYVEEFGIKIMMTLLLIVVGVLGLTLYKFEATITDILGLTISTIVALYGFAYLGDLVNQRRAKKSKNPKT
ncbi:hypothetical protein E3E31_02815 [Thermococcus sp. M39]|uniref:hypothetical protein n=1 Tax=unclassified Thermococcus TaxID=2627626 RepID=UPI00143A637A|nr:MULTISPECIES: hypothetical protein [unclassified Thermococcus]NJE07475.1 hypothetical protein [Thermococcus sp. M39]NJE12392.1 hypothetical protein [Thermococcus sp. LS2]